MTDQKKINILRVTYLRGPNIWTYRPVIGHWSISARWKTFLQHTARFWRAAQRPGCRG